MEGGLFVIVLLAVLALIVAFKTAIVVPQQSAFVVERLGRYSGTLNAGFHILVPFIDIIRQRCDVVVVDTPPGLGAITRRVLCSSDRVIVPLQCEPLVLQTTPQILRGIQNVAATHAALTFDGILLTMYEAGNAACERTTEYIRTHLPTEMVFEIVIPRSPAMADAFAAGQPAVLRSPADEASQAYVNLATFLAERFKA